MAQTFFNLYKSVIILLKMITLFLLTHLKDAVNSSHYPDPKPSLKIMLRTIQYRTNEINIDNRHPNMIFLNFD